MHASAAPRRPLDAVSKSPELILLEAAALISLVVAWFLLVGDARRRVRSTEGGLVGQVAGAGM